MTTAQQRHRAAAGAHEAAARATEARITADRLHDALGANESQQLLTLATDIEIGCQQAAHNTSAAANEAHPDPAAIDAALWADDAPNGEQALEASEAAATAHHEAAEGLKAR